MIFKGIALTIVVIILAIAMIVFFILAVVKRKNKPLRNRFILGGGAMLVLSLFTAVFLIYKAVNVGVYYGEQVAKTGGEFVADVLSPRYIMSHPHLQKLESMQPEGVKIPGEYYTYAGFRDYYRMPLIYPYSLIAIDTLDKAYLQDETGCRILLSSNDAKTIFYNIVKFRFDSQYMYAELYDSDKEIISYALFNFKTGELKKFKDEEETYEAATNAGLDMEQPLYTIPEYYVAFSDVY